MDVDRNALPSSPEPPPSSSTTEAWGPGARIGGYIVERAIARGGMGEVLLALDERLQKKVALKVLPRSDADDEARARFLREARALARVEHPAVVRVLASGDDGGVAWMALEYIEGDSLTDLSAGEAIDEETAVALMAQVARGLVAVHAVGVVHRDVKPANLLVDHDANVKIVDFGVALFPGGDGFTTRAGVVVGTPHFMSPEQARGGVVDARSDAWSLGATLWMLLAGRPPFWGADDEPDVDILARLVRDPVPDVGAFAPKTSSATIALLGRLLEKDPLLRPVDLGGVADELEQIAAALAAGEVPSTPPSASPPTLAPSTLAPSSPESSSLPAAPAVDGVPAGRLLAGFGVIGLVVAGVVGGAVVGQRFAAPRVEERVVERVVKVEVPVPVQVPAPPVVPAPAPSPAAHEPTAEELAHALASTLVEDLPAAVDDVLRRDDDVARAALVLAARTAGPAGDVVVRRALFDERVDRAALLDAALQSPGRSRALIVVAQLQSRRDDAAYLALRRIAESHRDGVVRETAAAARDSIFSAGE